MGVQQFFEKHKEGSFHSQLGVPKGQTIPISLLERIRDGHIGDKIYNEDSTTPAKEYITITPLMVKKARFLLNMRKNYKRSY